jgi:hypothetical protein
VAGANIAAVEDVLDREVDLRGGGFTHDLDSVSECGDGSVSPARTAILGDMLVEGLGTVVHSIAVTPGEVGREGRGRNHILRSWGNCERAFVHKPSGLGLLFGPDLVDTSGSACN